MLCVIFQVILIVICIISTFIFPLWDTQLKTAGACGWGARKSKGKGRHQNDWNQEFVAIKGHEADK